MKKNCLNCIANSLQWAHSLTSKPSSILITINEHIQTKLHLVFHYIFWRLIFLDAVCCIQFPHCSWVVGNWLASFLSVFNRLHFHCGGFQQNISLFISCVIHSGESDSWREIVVSLTGQDRTKNAIMTTLLLLFVVISHDSLNIDKTKLRNSIIFLWIFFCIQIHWEECGQKYWRDI